MKKILMTAASFGLWAFYALMMVFIVAGLSALLALVLLSFVVTVATVFAFTPPYLEIAAIVGITSLAVCTAAAVRSVIYQRKMREQALQSQASKRTT